MGSIFDCDADALVNPVNTIGVMGRGLALAFKQSFPDVFAAYARACKAKQVEIGKMFVVERAATPRYVIHFPTKRHFRYPSKLEYIDAGLTDLVVTLRDRRISSVAIPALGCGLGGLAWDVVKSRIVRAMDRVPEVRVTLFDPE